MRFDIITIFPRIFDSYFSESIIKRAQTRGVVTIHSHDLRRYTNHKHKVVDDRPYGGGAGMVLMAEPLLRAADDIVRKTIKKEKRKVIVLSAKGKQFTQKMAVSWAKRYEQIVVISGRYEGVDERVKTALRAQEISIGPYVLTDGDLAAMVLVSAMTRLVPGAINRESLAEESFSADTLREEAKSTRCEYPHYTRPEVLEWNGKKYRVPKVLLSGDHKKIGEWRKSKQK